MGSPINPLIANIFMEEFEVNALQSFPHPLPLAQVCGWHLCHQQGRTQPGLTAPHQQSRPTHPVYSRTNTTRITTLPGHTSYHTTRQHLQHFSIQKTNTHRPIPTLRQQPPHHSKTMCIQNLGTQGQNSVFYPGQHGQRTYKCNLLTESTNDTWKKYNCFSETTNIYNFDINSSGVYSPWRNHITIS